MQQTCNQPIKFGLALHTTTEVLALAIANVKIAQPAIQGSDAIQSYDPTTDTQITDIQLQKHQTWHLGRELSSQIHDILKIFLADFKQELSSELSQTSAELYNCSIWDNLAWIAIAKGVGSFTSTRVGIVLARTLGQQLDIPVYAIDCEAIARHAEQSQLDLAESLWQLVNQQWRNQLTAENPDLKHPHWSEALPAYGGEFGSSS